MGVTISRSIKKFAKDIETFVAKGLKEAAEDTAMAAILESPVDTGAFVTSWTISEKSNRGRSRSSKGKPKTTASQAMSEAADLIAGDLASIPDDAKSIYLNNRAPHAGVALAGMGSRSTEEIVNLAKGRFEGALRSYFK